MFLRSLDIGIAESACNFRRINIAAVRQGNDNILGKGIGGLAVGNNGSRLFRFPGIVPIVNQRQGITSICLSNGNELLVSNVPGNCGGSTITFSNLQKTSFTSNIFTVKYNRPRLRTKETVFWTNTVEINCCIPCNR